LDLSLRNKLINFKIGPSAPQLVYNSGSQMLEEILRTDKIYLYPNDKILPANVYYEYSDDSLEESSLYSTCKCLL
jgi:hypothetical protein